MKCSRCGNAVLIPAAFCPACGTQLQLSPSSTPASDPQTSQLNASDIVLMFGDRFATPREEGYKVPCSQVEVSVSSLVIAIVTTALASLASENIVSVARGQKKGFLFKSEAAIIRKSQEPMTARSGLEGKILDSLIGDEQKDSVRDIVRRLLGQTTMDPYTVILSQAMEHAHQAGFFIEDEKAPPIVKFLAGRTVAAPLSPLCDRIATASAEAEKVQRLLDAFRAAQPDLYDLIGKDVKRSLDSAYIQT